MLLKQWLGAFLLGFGIGLSPCALAQPVTSDEAQSALKLYSAKQYGPAATAFEKIIRRQPTASYCYYAALANRASNKELRAKELFQFIVNNFPASPEAKYAKQIVGEPATATPAPDAAASVDPVSGAAALPDSVRALVPPAMLKMMETPAGKQAVADAMKQNEAQVATIRKAEAAGVMPKDKLAAYAQKHGVGSAAVARTTSPAVQPIKEQPFTAADIARDGAKAIDQMRYPNCWFECSMAALADLPRGQRLIASMIRARGADTYVVRFPGDGVEYVISKDDLRKAGIHDSALWASLIECAQTRKFPDNAGAEGSEGLQSRLEVGLGCITGCKAQVLTYLQNSSVQELSSFIGSAVKSQNPVVASTYPYNPSLPEIVVPTHAYTVIGFDPSRNMITLRNPHGKNSDRFELEGDPKHLDFEQLDDGVFKISVRLFQRYFYSVARSFI